MKRKGPPPRPARGRLRPFPRPRLAFPMLLLLGFAAACSGPHRAEEGAPGGKMAAALRPLAAALLPEASPFPGPLAVGEILCRGRRSELGDEVAAALTALLRRRAPELAILSRADLRAVLAEQRLQMSDLFQGPGVEAGRLLPARSLLEGFLFPGGEGGAVRLQARVLDLEKGTVLSAGSVALPRRSVHLRPPAEDLPLEVAYGVFARPGRGGPERILREGDTLYSGDLLRVRLKPNRPAWVYLFLLDSQGEAHLLFPPSPEGEARVTAGELLLPSWSTYWRLDRHPGRETLLAAASLAPLEGMEGLLHELRDGAERLRSAAVLERVGAAGAKGMVGVSRVSKGEEGALDGVLRSYTGVVWKRFDFLHRP